MNEEFSFFFVSSVFILNPNNVWVKQQYGECNEVKIIATYLVRERNAILMHYNGSLYTAIIFIFF